MNEKKPGKDPKAVFHKESFKEMKRSKNLDRAYEDAQDYFRACLFDYEPAEWSYWNVMHRGIKK